MKEYKCYYCKNKDAESNLEVEATEKIKKTTDKFGLPVKKVSITRKRYHQKCRDEFEKNKMYREKLFNYIADKYQLLVVPPNFYKQFLKYMSDNNISPELAYRTYEYIGDSIEWSLKNVGFDDSNKALSYGFAIFRNKVNEVYQETLKAERKKKEEELRQERDKEFVQQFREITYKKRDEGIVDISNFL